MAASFDCDSKKRKFDSCLSPNYNIIIMDNKRQFETIELGTTYRLPKYRVIDDIGIKITDFNNYEGLSPEAYEGQLQTITFVRGDKTNGDKLIPRVDGILHEQLLAMMITDLQYKSSLVPSKETALAITKLQEALFWLEERVRERETRGVLETYTK